VETHGKEAKPNINPIGMNRQHTKHIDGSPLHGFKDLESCSPCISMHGYQQITAMRFSPRYNVLRTIAGGYDSHQTSNRPSDAWTLERQNLATSSSQHPTLTAFQTLSGL